MPFHPKRIPHHFADVLIIGGGIAGLRAAMEIDPRLSLLVITKDTMEQSNSAYAQGGIASVLDPDDNFESHVDDTLIAGANLCDREVVEMVVREAPEHIRQLIEWGTQLRHRERRAAAGPRRRAQPSPHRARPGRRHRPRSHAGDDRSRRARSSTPRSGTTRSRSTCSRTKAAAAARWCGTPQHGRTFVWAKQTILCTGGAGQIYRETTNPESPPATAMRSPIAPAPSCATWSSCSFIRRCCTSPAAAAA